MFTSKEHLQNNLGVDPEIAAFFVDRRVPVNNPYWKGRYLYVAGGTGYLFIPIFFDLQYKCGLDREIVLNEDYVQLTEEILGSAALYEFGHISFDIHIQNCKNLTSATLKNENLYHDLLEYFKNEDLTPYKNLGTGSKALNRGDTFLFSLCSLDLTTALLDKIIREWYALVPSFLLMDDIIDLKEDQQKNEENAVSDFGKGTAGIEMAIEFLRNKFSDLKHVNVKLGEYFETSLDRKLKTPYMLSLLNN